MSTTGALALGKSSVILASIIPRHLREIRPLRKTREAFLQYGNVPFGLSVVLHPVNVSLSKEPVVYARERRPFLKICWAGSKNTCLLGNGNLPSTCAHRVICRHQTNDVSSHHKSITYIGLGDIARKAEKFSIFIVFPGTELQRLENVFCSCNTDDVFSYHLVVQGKCPNLFNSAQVAKNEGVDEVNQYLVNCFACSLPNNRRIFSIKVD
mmetsp:Transcript_8112/g.14378  ORF Transcript_8112/g.14378 Transcript_8112/m.14378 type:complete len:210 (-) Transcript_8112:1237-1866(-)